MKLAEKWVHPTIFTGNWPDWSGYTWLDYNKSNNTYHPGDDYNFGYGDQDLGQDVASVSAGIVVHTSKSTIGYGNIIIIKHQIGYNLKRFILTQYGIDTDTLYSFYAHLKDILVAVGNEVDTGSLIGHVGKSGTELAHLHFEIYASIGDLVGKDWRFWPTGWSKEQIAKCWLPAYKFIEATKQAEDITETFLGKPRAYWEQVEKDREGLLRQIGEVEGVWAKKLETAEIEIGTLKEELLKRDEEIKKRDDTIRIMGEDFEKERTDFKGKIILLENRITELLKDQAKQYTTKEAFSILFYSIFPKGAK